MAKMNIPNQLTMVRLFCTPLMIALFLIDIPNGIGVFIALGIYILACITDFLDGYIARKYNMITDFGKFMDQIADKFITTSALILVMLSGITISWLAALIILIVVLRDILISGIRMVAANKKIVIAADIFGKVKSLFLDLASMVLMLYVGLISVLPNGVYAEIFKGFSVEYIRCFGLGLMLVGVALTIVSAVNYSVNAIKSLKKVQESE